MKNNKRTYQRPRIITVEVETAFSVLAASGGDGQVKVEEGSDKKPFIDFNGSLSGGGDAGDAAAKGHNGNLWDSTE